MKKKWLNILYLFMLINPVIDIITSLTLRFTNITLTLGLIARGIFFCILLFFIIFISKSKYKKYGIIYLLFLVLYVCIYLSNKTELYSEVTYLFKFLYFPISLVSLILMMDEYRINEGVCQKIFIVNMIFMVISILIAFITNTSFASYGSDNVGCIGWFYSANEIGSIFAITFPFIFYILKRYKSFKVLLIILLIVFVMSLIGTKTPFLSALFSSLVFGIYFFVRRKKYTNKPFIAVIITMAFIILLSPYLSVIDNIKNTLNLKDDPSSALSKRDVFLKNIIKIQSKSGDYEVLMGVGFTTSDTIKDKNITKLIEMDMFDVYFRYGIIGTIIYFSPLIICLVLVIRYLIMKAFKLTYDMLIYGFSVSIALFISFLAGHLISSPAVSLYLSLSIILLVNSMYETAELKEEVTIYALSLTYGGVEKFISNLCKMIEDDYKINLVVTYKIGNPAFEFSDKVNIKYLINRGPNKKELKEAIKSKNIFKILKELFISFIIISKRYILNLYNIMNNNSKYIITTRFHNYLVSEYASKESIKISTEHNYHNNDKKYINKIISSILHFDYFVVPTKELYKFYENNIYNTKCVYIPNVITKKEKEKSKLNKKNIINVSRFSNEKGLFDLIDVFESVNSESKNTKLYLIGDGYLKDDLIKYVESKKLEKSVLFTGFLKEKEQEKYYLDSSLYVMTSFTESFGLTLIESASFNVPSLAFDSASGPREILGKNNLIKNRDKNKMSKKIIELFNDKKKILSMSKECEEIVNKYYYKNVKNDWLKLLEEK